ncbi:SDR family NAD(P)-dependent oxidoreductase, partial [Rhizobium sp. AQ_MP]|uniref:SDR family NAD(P)-dependent oxidoreductase n=1 Tax=Rhizobium sp. AQ_MP TaxID=2761536 RepID=UPI00163ABB25
MGRLTEKNALIIGGTHGMGLATAKALVADGAQVLVTGANPSNVHRAHLELEGRANAMGSDISRAQDREVLAAMVAERFQSLDALFIFAAVAEFAPFDQ